MRTRKIDKQINYSHGPAQIKQVDYCVIRTFWCIDEHGQTQIRRLTTTQIVFFMPSHAASIQMSFCFKTPKWESRNSQKLKLSSL